MKVHIIVIQNNRFVLAFTFYLCSTIPDCVCFVVRLCQSGLKHISMILFSPVCISVLHSVVSLNCVTERDVASSCSVQSSCSGLSDQSLMVDPLRYFSFQLVLHNWCNEGCVMYYPVWDIAYKRSLAANQKD